MRMCQSYYSRHLQSHRGVRCISSFSAIAPSYSPTLFYYALTISHFLASPTSIISASFVEASNHLAYPSQYTSITLHKKKPVTGRAVGDVLGELKDILSLRKELKNPQLELIFEKHWIEKLTRVKIEELAHCKTPTSLSDRLHNLDLMVKLHQDLFKSNQFLLAHRVTTAIRRQNACFRREESRPEVNIPGN